MGPGGPIDSLQQSTIPHTPSAALVDPQQLLPGLVQPPRGGGGVVRANLPDAPPPLCDIPSGCCSFPGPWTVTRSSLRMLRRVAAFCRPLRPVLLLVSFPRSRSPVVGVLGLCWMWHGVPFVRQWRPPPPGLCLKGGGGYPRVPQPLASCLSSPPNHLQPPLQPPVTAPNRFVSHLQPPL